MIEGGVERAWFWWMIQRFGRLAGEKQGDADGLRPVRLQGSAGGRADVGFPLLFGLPDPT
jgi:hypothetical protein